MPLRFEWNSEKAAINAKKHGISFDEASTAFADNLSLTIADPVHSHGEERLVLVGESFRGNLVVVVHAERADGTIRIISARPATKAERRVYEES